VIEELNLRQATKDDIDFVIETIIESEKSGSEMISSCQIFGITEKRFKNILREILCENIPDYDYYLSGFLIAEKNGEYVGAIGSWLEAADGTPSGFIKTTILYPFLDWDKMKEISKNASFIKDLTVNRGPGALQLEYEYTRSQFRRQGVLSHLIKESILMNRKKYNRIEKVQVALLKANLKSFDAHIKLGFTIVEEKHVENPEIFKFFPFNTKVLLEINKEDFSRF
jgi:hypothetical protein